jgi:hypothetical protein
MKFGNLVLAAALAFGIGGAASAAPLAPSPTELIKQPDTLVEYAKRRGHGGWRGSRGRHYGWYKPRRVYFAPRRHYRSYYRPAYYAYPRRHYRAYRPAYYAYPRRHYGYGYYPRSRGVFIRF